MGVVLQIFAKTAASRLPNGAARRFTLP